ncbi:EpsG family protein [Paenibacillus silvisoli]|uniref:EpsG family protein n=1 Tax=Paenibacillus silvisoli TaxID=3110539 RepID=UPI002804F37B|nr:EpsG family protein [Paenibacillus silvisoli]
MTIMFGIFLLLAAFRDSVVGNDTAEYVRQFGYYKGLPYFNYNLDISRYESGYVLLNTVIKTFTDNYTVLLFIVSLFYLYSVGRFINNYSKFIWLSVFIFYTLGIYFMVFNLLRQCIAIGIFIIAIDFIIKGKPFKYLLSILLATLFHKTAIVLLPLYLLRNKKMNFKIVIVSLLILSFILLFFDNIMLLVNKVFPHYYSYYYHSKYSENGARLATVLHSLLIIILFVVGRVLKSKYVGKGDVSYKSVEHKAQLDLVDNLFEVLTIVNITIMLISLRLNLLDRFGDYFLPIMAVYLPNTITKGGRVLHLISYILVIILFLYITIILIFRPDWSGIFPYKFIESL